jgi:hypothetical protein
MTLHNREAASCEDTQFVLHTFALSLPERVSLLCDTPVPSFCFAGQITLVIHRLGSFKWI